MDLLIRDATGDDADLIAELTRNCWADKVAPSSSGHREAAPRVAQDLQHGGGFVLLCHNTAVGSVRWTPLDAEPGVWEIMRMGILPGYRGERLSQHLMEALIHRALATEVDELRLAVRTDQPRLLDLYAAFGFAIAPELKYTRANLLEPAPIVMRRRLHN